MLRGERVRARSRAGRGTAGSAACFSRRSACRPGNVGNHFNSSRTAPRLPFAAGRGLTRRSVRGRLETQVSLAPFAPRATMDVLAGPSKILKQEAAAGIVDQRAGRDEQREILRRAAVNCAVPPRSPLAAFQVFFCVSAARLSTPPPRTKDHAAAIAAVAAVRPAARHVLLAPEADHAISRPAPLALNKFYFVGQTWPNSCSCSQAEILYCTSTEPEAANARCGFGKSSLTTQRTPKEGFCNSTLLPDYAICGAAARSKRLKANALATPATRKPLHACQRRCTKPWGMMLTRRGRCVQTEHGRRRARTE